MLGQYCIFILEAAQSRIPDVHIDIKITGYFKLEMNLKLKSRYFVADGTM